MNNSGGKPEHSLNINFFLKEIEIIESNNSSIFHGPPTILMHKHLIIFIEREGVVEILLIKFHRFYGYFEDEL